MPCGFSAWGPPVLYRRLGVRMLSRRASGTSGGLTTPVVEQMATWTQGTFQKAQEGPEGQGL